MAYYRSAGKINYFNRYKLIRVLFLKQRIKPSYVVFCCADGVFEVGSRLWPIVYRLSLMFEVLAGITVR